MNFVEEFVNFIPPEFFSGIIHRNANFLKFKSLLCEWVPLGNSSGPMKHLASTGNVPKHLHVTFSLISFDLDLVPMTVSLKWITWKMSR